MVAMTTGLTACGVFYSAVSKSVTIYFDVNHSQCKCVLHIFGKLQCVLHILAMLVRSLQNKTRCSLQSPKIRLVVMRAKVPHPLEYEAKWP